MGQIQPGVSRFKPTEATKIVFDKICGSNINLRGLFLVSQYCTELTSDFLKLSYKNPPLYYGQRLYLTHFHALFSITSLQLPEFQLVLPLLTSNIFSHNNLSLEQARC